MVKNSPRTCIVFLATVLLVSEEFSCLFRQFDVLARALKAKHQLSNPWSIRMGLLPAWSVGFRPEWTIIFCVDCDAPTKPFCLQKSCLPKQASSTLWLCRFLGWVSRGPDHISFQTRTRARTISVASWLSFEFVNTPQGVTVSLDSSDVGLVIVCCPFSIGAS